MAASKQCRHLHCRSTKSKQPGVQTQLAKPETSDPPSSTSLSSSSACQNKLRTNLDKKRTNTLPRLPGAPGPGTSACTLGGSMLRLEIKTATFDTRLSSAVAPGKGGPHCRLCSRGSTDLPKRVRGEYRFTASWPNQNRTPWIPTLRMNVLTTCEINACNSNSGVDLVAVFSNSPKKSSLAYGNRPASHRMPAKERVMKMNGIAAAKEEEREQKKKAKGMFELKSCWKKHFQ